MTVNRLINLLSDYHPDRWVFIENKHGELYEITSVRINDDQNDDKCNRVISIHSKDSLHQ